MIEEVYKKLLFDYESGKFINSKREKVLKKYFYKNEGKLLNIGSVHGVTTIFLRSIVNNEIYTCDMYDHDSPFHKKCNVEYLSDYYDPDTFDMLFAGEIIEHLVYPERFIKNCFSIIRNNGTLILTTPNYTSYLNLLFRYNMRDEEDFQRQKVLVDNNGPMEYAGHISVMSIKQLKKICAKYFKIIEHCTTGYSLESSYGTRFPWAFPIRQRINSVLPRYFREQQLIVLKAIK